MKLLITNIQKFSLHDGPGIRTTVFVKGCNLHCPWCANPENIKPEKQFFFCEEKCISQNDECVYGDCKLKDGVWTRDKISDISENDYNLCKSGAIGSYGREYEVNELVEILLVDKKFWNPGGVTFSGGEPLFCFSQAVYETIKKLKTLGIHVCVETALCIDSNVLIDFIPYIDLFYVDIKFANEENLKTIVGGDFQKIKNNLKLLAQNNANVVIRHPIIAGYTDAEENEIEIMEMLKEFPEFRYQTIQENRLGEYKRKTLGLL